MLGPLLFLIFINDIVTDINSKINLFADDTSLYMIVNSPIETATQMQLDIEKKSNWANNWLVQFNPNISESMVISKTINKPYHPPLSMSNVSILVVESHKHLGCFLSYDASWQEHIS
jgi:hypothetical protein